MKTGAERRMTQSQRSTGWYRLSAFLFASVLLAGCGSRARPECATEPPADGATPQATEAALNPDQVQLLWEAGPHASSQAFENSGEDGSCARCHAPESWAPPAGELPLSWSQAGITPGTTLASAQGEWSPVGCAVCHQGEAEEIEGEIAWLEVPPALVYSPVETATELCEKCHLAGDVEDHLSISVSGSHLEMTCTECHDPHDTTASCTGSGCHEPFAEECEPIETHDKPHMEASCSACHDADLLPIDWNEADQVWDTVIRSATGDGYRTYASHALVLEVACERCHEPGNHPWGDTKE